MSTPQCPNCSTVLSDDYGMITCPSCGVIVFVDMDGLAHVASKEADPVETPPVADSTFGSSNEPEIAVPWGLSEQSATADSSGTTPTATADAALNMDGFLGYQNPDEPNPAPQLETNDPLGISAYANSEMSGAADGPFVVTVIVSGIDAKDLRDDIRQVLQDPRFSWDASALMAGIKNGELRLERIAPVKATIVVNRIKHLAVSIRWEQNAITDFDADQSPSP